MIFTGNGTSGKRAGEEDFVGKKKHRTRERLSVWPRRWRGFAAIGRRYRDSSAAKDGKVATAEEHAGTEENRAEGVREGLWDEVCDEGRQRNCQNGGK